MVFIFPLSGACLKPFGTFPSHIPQASQRLGKLLHASVPPHPQLPVAQNNQHQDLGGSEARVTNAFWRQMLR